VDDELARLTRAAKAGAITMTEYDQRAAQLLDQSEARALARRLRRMSLPEWRRRRLLATTRARRVR